MKYSRKYELARDALERGRVLYMYTWEILGGKRGSDVTCPLEDILNRDGHRGNGAKFPKKDCQGSFLGN